MFGLSIMDWLDDPAPGRGIRFARRDDGWDFHSYADLAVAARSTSHGLLASGVGPGDTVALVHRPGPSFVAGFFGALLAGATPTVVAPPIALQHADDYATHVGGVLAAARPALVVADAALVDRVGPIAAKAADVDTIAPEHLPQPRGAVLDRSPAEIALLQFTSGSSGIATGVRVPAGALAANLSAIGRWLGIRPEDPTATWLPVHHDMGLIGCLLTPVTHRADIWVLRPEDFVRNPIRYLRCFGVDGARLTAIPSFGLRHLARRIRPEQLEGYDFSAWRAIIVGAERVDPAALADAHALLGPFGLAREAFLPAYGLAEATLAVTGLDLPTPWTSVRVDPAKLAPGSPVQHIGEGCELVGCGAPMTGVRLRIVDDDGDAVPDGHVGEIEVGGDSVAAGYLDHVEATRTTALTDGTLRTGDAGFQLDGQLYVLGRLGDSIKVRGRTVFAEDIEAALEPLGAPPRRMIALLGVHEGEPLAVVVFELARPQWLADAPRLLTPHLDGARVVVLDAPRGVLNWTTSGKPRRRPLWRDYVAGRLAEVEAVHG
jgi:acyl-CoA synthetase (AMP-forming)/AMP-acid ligase II